MLPVAWRVEIALLKNAEKRSDIFANTASNDHEARHDSELNCSHYRCLLLRVVI